MGKFMEKLLTMHQDSIDLLDSFSDDFGQVLPSSELMFISFS